MRAASRLADVSIVTVSKLLVDIGQAAAQYQDQIIHNVQSKRVQVDETWAFCYSKAKNIPERMKGQKGVGDVWTWVALDADTKLVVTWLVGSRDLTDATRFMKDLKSRVAGRIQLTSDGHAAYPDAVERAFGDDVDFAQLVKIYGNAPEERRYSPPECIGARQTVVNGNPENKHISTSYVERQNLTMRMSMRRFTRLSNGFSKKIENHAHAIALYFLHYNFARVHQTLRVTPAMESGLAATVWTHRDIAALLD